MNFRSAALSAGIFIFAVAFPQGQAIAASPFEQAIGDFWNGFTGLFGAHSSPAVDAIKPRVTLPRDGRKVDHTKFYLVKLKCSASPNTAKLISEGLAIKQETFVSHALWFSNSAGDGKVPANPVKLVNAFSFEKDASGNIQEVDNRTCSETFLLSGENDVLTVSFSLTDTKSVAGVSKALSSTLKLAAGIVPLFVGGPLAAVVTTASKAAGDAADPIKDLVAAMNASPRKAVLSITLRSGVKPTVISTAYSQISMTVTPVTDVSTQISKDNNLRKSFYSLFDGISASMLKDMTAAVALEKCAGFANILQKNYSFGKKDNSFLVGYFAQSAFPGNIENRLNCIGNRYMATDIVQFGFVYNVDLAALRAITLEDIANVFDANGYPRTPLNASIARSYTEKLANLWAKYAQTDATDPKPAQRLMKWIGSEAIAIDDPTTDISDDPSMTAEAFVEKLSSVGFKRYGCFILKPTVGAGAYDAMILALPLKPADGDTFKPVEALGMRVILAGTSKTDYPAVLKKVQLTREPTAIIEAAKAFDGLCYSAKIALPK